MHPWAGPLPAQQTDDGPPAAPRQACSGGESLVNRSPTYMATQWCPRQEHAHQQTRQSSPIGPSPSGSRGLLLTTRRARERYDETRSPDHPLVRARARRWGAPWAPSSRHRRRQGNSRRRNREGLAEPDLVDSSAEMWRARSQGLEVSRRKRQGLKFDGDESFE